jgi:hypothetical protein
MTSGELKRFIHESGLTQAALAKLLGVTARAVSLWLIEERAIPGPAEAYMRVFKSLPPNLRQQEETRLNDGETKMRDGMFGISFTGPVDSGIGVLVFDSGRIYGSDGGARYDGTYVFNEKSGRADLLLKVTFPPGVNSVFGITNPYEWSIDVATSIDPRADRGNSVVKTSLGKNVNAQFTYLRALPDAA